MFKKLSLSVASLAVLTACSACTTMPSDGAADGQAAVEKAAAVATPSASELEKVAAMYTGNKVHFGFDSAALSPESQARLKAIATRIKSENPAQVIVEGHCDERGTREYNLALGDRRAVSAKKYLVGLGVDSSKIKTISYGKERPLDAAHNPKAWEQNRRAVVKF
ncbi:MAG: peptidoglycan-associated lipoprotein [Magnetococcales bacterium]|nr:peptidoglycan-associated lipoprotein [Magnetococcales bacterium]PPR15326.1 MAG: Outer membrane protein P6 [Pseudomonadota bacterium]|tara:strand:+ start:454 stop:948 length:495 start_codon:yes stop_codon:yes gene_type:complete